MIAGGGGVNIAQGPLRFSRSNGLTIQVNLRTIRSTWNNLLRKLSLRDASCSAAAIAAEILFAFRQPVSRNLKYIQRSGKKIEAKSAVPKHDESSSRYLNTCVRRLGSANEPKVLRKAPNKKNNHFKDKPDSYNS